MRTLNLLISYLLGAGLVAAQPCTVADVRGTYQYRLWGWQELGPAHPALPNTMGPTYGLGVVTLDGAGKGSGKFTATLGGVPQTHEYVDFQYTVNKDCSGTATYRLKVAGNEAVLGPDTLNLHVLEDGARLMGMTTDAPGRGAIVRSEFQRLGRGARACHESTVRGSYAMYYEGWINMQMLNPNQPGYFAPEIGAGLVVLEPNGASHGSGVHNWGGVRLASDLSSMAFSVNEDCTGTFEYVAQIRGTPNKISGKWPIVVSGDGARITVLGLNPPAFQYYERVSIP
jgi:hypothetical protein